MSEAATAMSDEAPPSGGRKPRTDVRVSFSMNERDAKLFEQVMDAMGAYSASDAFRRLVWEKHAQITGEKAAKPAKPGKAKRHR
jgi:hypothetical protein